VRHAGRFSNIRFRLSHGELNWITCRRCVANIVEYKCNLDCWYCWAFDNKAKGMTQDVARRSIRLAARQRLRSASIDGRRNPMAACSLRSGIAVLATVIIRTDGTIRPVLPHVFGHVRLGNIDALKLDHDQTREMKKTCQRHCLHTEPQPSLLLQRSPNHQMAVATREEWIQRGSAKL
jgi:hypothetical protein